MAVPSIRHTDTGTLRTGTELSLVGGVAFVLRFWKCPNGGECKYRHALPAGYVLKSQMKELLEEQNANRKDVADLIEEERSRVVAKTPITGAVSGGKDA